MSKYTSAEPSRSSTFSNNIPGFVFIVILLALLFLVFCLRRLAKMAFSRNSSRRGNRITPNVKLNRANNPPDRPCRNPRQLVPRNPRVGVDEEMSKEDIDRAMQPSQPRQNPVPNRLFLPRHPREGCDDVMTSEEVEKSYSEIKVPRVKEEEAAAVAEVVDSPSSIPRLEEEEQAKEGK